MVAAATQSITWPSSNIEGVEFICANTDAQALKNIGARTVLQLGPGVTKGLGAGANPEVGRQAALEDRERIAEVLQRHRHGRSSPPAWVAVPAPARRR